MPHRLDPDARRTLAKNALDARMRGTAPHDTDSGDVLVALVSTERTALARLLNSRGITESAVREALAQDGQSVPEKPFLPFPRAVRMAYGSGLTHASNGHILASLIDDRESRAHRALAALTPDVNALRQEALAPLPPAFPQLPADAPRYGRLALTGWWAGFGAVFAALAAAAAPPHWGFAKITILVLTLAGALVPVAAWRYTANAGTTPRWVTVLEAPAFGPALTRSGLGRLRIFVRAGGIWETVQLGRRGTHLSANQRLLSEDHAGTFAVASGIARAMWRFHLKRRVTEAAFWVLLAECLLFVHAFWVPTVWFAIRAVALWATTIRAELAAARWAGVTATDNWYDFRWFARRLEQETHPVRYWCRFVLDLSAVPPVSVRHRCWEMMVGVHDLHRRWNHVVAEATESGRPDREMTKSAYVNVVTRWMEPHRRYHTLDHLAAMLGIVDGAESARLSGIDFAAIRFAVFFHDAIYETDPLDPGGPSNEQRSADLARYWLDRLGIPADRVDEVVRLILLTAGHAVEPSDVNGALMADADLAILGSEPERYAEYTRQIRAEYAHVPDDAFRAGRTAVLTSLLALPRLYHLPAHRERWEALARANMTAEIVSLR